LRLFFFIEEVMFVLADMVNTPSFMNLISKLLA
jgi:hypothetical protein